jgi:hypothetical protein
MVLMAIHDIDVAEFAQQSERDRIGPLSPHVPGLADHANLEVISTIVAVVGSPKATRRVEASRAMSRAS